MIGSSIDGGVVLGLSFTPVEDRTRGCDEAGALLLAACGRPRHFPRRVADAPAAHRGERSRERAQAP